MRARFKVTEGAEIGFAMRWAPVESREPAACAPGEVRVGSATPSRGGNRGRASDIYEGPHRDAIRVLARSEGPHLPATGAIVAAPTTSLPEDLAGSATGTTGSRGSRPSLTLEALYVGACPDEVENFISFMTDQLGRRGRAGDERSLQIVHGIGGEPTLRARAAPPARMARLRPVRVGSSAWGQTQLDVYGELMNSLYLHRERIGSSTPRSSASSPSSPTRQAAGTGPGRGYGRCGASPSTTSTPRSCAGSPSIAPPSSHPSSASSRADEWAWSATGSAMRSSSGDGARSARRTPRRSTPTSSTRACC